MNEKQFIKNLISRRTPSAFEFSCLKNDIFLSKKSRELAVGGKVAIFFTDKSFKEQRESLTALLEGVGVKTVDYICNESELQLEKLTKMFNMPEDVRAVIAFEQSIMANALYFCSVKQIPIIIPLSQMPADKVFISRVAISNGVNLEQVELTAKRYVNFYAPNIMGSDFATIYARVMAGMIALIDYRINCAVKGEALNLQAYTTLREAVIDCFGVYQKKQGEQGYFLALNYIKSCMADYSCGNKMFTTCAVNCINAIVGQEKFNGAQIITAITLVLELYEIAFCGEYDNILTCPDYTSRVEYLTSVFGIDESAFLHNFVVTNKQVSGNQNVARAIKHLRSEISALNKQSKKILNCYYALGGKGNSDSGLLKKAVKHSGDLPYAFNGMTLAREFGITEHL